MNDIITVIVLPATRAQREQSPKPLRAFVQGVQNESGSGGTVLEAIEDLFTSAKVGRYCKPLEQALAEMGELAKYVP